MNQFNTFDNWKRLIRYPAFALAAIGLAQAAAAQDRFIDGFPDVPYLDIIEVVLGDPMVFDTASGTVAEVSIQFSVPAARVLDDYATALSGLGWTCTKTARQLSCLRDTNIVQLAPANNGAEAVTFILRLEPRQ